MTAIKIILPDLLAREADAAGLLAPSRLEKLLRSELRQQRVANFFDDLELLDSSDKLEMTPDEVGREIAAYRKERSH